MVLLVGDQDLEKKEESQGSRQTTILNVKLLIISYLSVLIFVLAAQKKSIETVILSTHNICFG